ncbi:MAG: hypothetical protein GX306_09260 [Clostridiales bacterium]|nr:hypothetical protein [Clostridiales bacterium]
MRRLMLCLIAVISISGSVLDEAVTVAMLSQKKDSKDEMIRNEPKMKAMTPMEALDLVKDRYATNFEKVYAESSDSYYYKLPYADYYLVMEGFEEDNSYLVHLYEFVMDEPDTGIGHTVTYGWYTVNKDTGIITEWIQ